MVLQFCQKQDVAAIANLLASSNSWVNPGQSCLEAAYYLFNLGLIRVKESYFIICAHEEDYLDWPNVVNLCCNNEIFIDPNFNEECDSIVCEGCGRYILPNTYQKQRFHLLSTKLNPEKIIDWFECQLTSSNLVWHKTTMGVYHIIAHGSLINFIIPDFCADKAYLTVDRLKVQPTALMTLRNDIHNIPLTLLTIPIADLLCEHTTLKEILLTTIENGVPEIIPNTSMQILPASYISLKHIVKPATSEKIVLHLHAKKEAFYINNIEVINEKASSQFDVFQILLEQFLNDFGMRLAPEEHKFLSLKELQKRLESKLEIIDLENQIRKPLNRMQRAIKKKLADKLGLNIGRNDVVQTLGWPELTHREYGYRLNPFVVLKK